MYETPNGILAAARELRIEASRFRQVDAARAATVLDKILETFTYAGSANRNRLWLWEEWEDLKEPTHAFVQPHEYRVIRDVAPASTRVWFMTEDWARTKRHGNYWLFEGELGAVTDVVANHHGIEYYVVSRKIDWMLIRNHHDVLFGVGEWIVERLFAMKAAGLIPGRDVR